MSLNYNPGVGESKHCIQITPDLYKYVVSNWLREPDVLAQLREETSKLPNGRMQISADQGQLFSLLIQMSGAKKTLEVGVFTGYSSLVVALALPEDGKVFALDVSEEYTNVAKRYWKQAGVEHKIQLTLAPGVESLDKLLDQGHEGTFDFAFIDADKVNYPHYYERVLKLLRKGGIVALDNVLRNGRVIDPKETDPDTEAIKKLNEFIHTDKRVNIALVPIGDGVTLAIKQ
mmetsp:Transcript_17257/g.23985  ORF Transcript_17257/g.23985 Transcript_17257/m.23985 type:complete len:231 (+) Transcript_17257:46-738(+)